MNALAKNLLENNEPETPEIPDNEWGFFGTAVRSTYLQNQLRELAKPLWEKAIAILVEELGIGENGAAQYLNSRAGRHLADQTFTDQGPDWANFTDLAVKWYQPP